MTSTSALVWFRRDLRLDDNPAWARATSTHSRVTALFIVDLDLADRASEPRRARLFGDLAALDERLASFGGRLLIRTGDPRLLVAAEASRLNVEAVYINRDVTPYSVTRDAAVETALAEKGIELRGEWGTVVHAPGLVRTNAGTLSQVFTPFFRAWERTEWEEWPTGGDTEFSNEIGEPLPTTNSAYPLLDDLVGDCSLPGELGALARLEAAAARADSYSEERNLPAIMGTSQLSIDLRFGTLSPRTAAEVIGHTSPGRSALVRQLSWRDWYAHLLYERPELLRDPMKPQYASMPWIDDSEGFAAWVRGQTGYPFVDAGMRQLRETGWMHNRVRMVTASFLVKNLLVDWRRGERYFRHVLLDADVSQNVGNWQWVAGTGPDASPYNRVFNPVLQGRRFDSEGAYIRRWVPELAGLSARALHEPWNVGPLELASAGVVLGDTYPAPIVDLAMSRERVLSAYQSVRE